jgi:hypothetical protein
LDNATGIGAQGYCRIDMQLSCEVCHWRVTSSRQGTLGDLRLPVPVSKPSDVYAAESPWVPKRMVAIARPRYIQKIDTEWGKLRLKK